MIRICTGRYVVSVLDIYSGVLSLQTSDCQLNLVAVMMVGSFVQEQKRDTNVYTQIHEEVKRLTGKFFSGTENNFC